MEIRYIDPIYLYPKKVIKIDNNNIMIIGTNNGIDYFTINGKKIEPKQIVNEYYNFEFENNDKKTYARILYNKIHWDDGTIWTKYKN